EFNSTFAETKIIVVVDFYTTWCGPCKVIAPQLEEWADEKERNVLLAEVDVENGETAEAAEVSAMPTFHFYKKKKKNDQKIDEVAGANENALRENITSLQ
ncbi:hypothetical protein EGW08_010381, partial [Elysia chlorotica]